MALETEARRQRAAFVLGGLGLLVLAAILGRAYSGWTVSRYAPAAAAVTRIDVNRAERTELERLPGIGPTLAGRIVDERAARGPFAGFADLSARVGGIGAALEQGLDGLVLFGR